MSTILITSLERMVYALARREPTHMISLLTEAHMIGTPRPLAPDRHLKMAIDDIAAPEPDRVTPARAHVDALLDFIDRWNGDGLLLIHCYAGISRSAAAAYITQCHFNPHGTEERLARVLRRAGGHLQPNPLLVRHGDEALARGGRMTRAVEALGPGTGINETGMVEVPLRLRDAGDAP